MSARFEKSLRTHRIVLHDGLVLSVQTDRLLGWVFEAVHARDWPAPRVHEGMPPAVLRTLLVYCYVAGIFGSEEIEAAANEDETVRYLCANHFPHWQEVRSFRRSNLPWLIEAVRQVLQAALGEHISECQASAAVFRCAPWGWDLRAEANRRLARAVQCDSAAMDA